MKNLLVVVLIIFACSTMTVAQSGNKTQLKSKGQVEMGGQENLMRSMYKEVHGVALDDKTYRAAIATSVTNLAKWKKVLLVQENKEGLPATDLKYLKSVIAGMTAKVGN